LFLPINQKGGFASTLADGVKAGTRIFDELDKANIQARTFCRHFRFEKRYEQTSGILVKSRKDLSRTHLQRHGFRGPSIVDAAS
jgi:hypothetical protein